MAKLAGTGDRAAGARRRLQRRAEPTFSNQYNSWLSLGILFLILPVLVGLFWGAPLVAREVEHGTHRLVWTQGVSRRRWALVKFGWSARSPSSWP